VAKNRAEHIPKDDPSLDPKGNHRRGDTYLPEFTK
jgi:hypothetical protein